MKKIELGQSISILANLGVVVGLILLALELSQANRQAEASAYQARISEIEEARREFAASEYLPGLYVKLNESGLESLTAEELSRLRSWESARLLRMQGQHNQFQQGFLEPEVHEGVIFAAAERVQFWLRLGVVATDSSFRAAIEEVLPTVQQLDRFEDVRIIEQQE